MKTFVFTLCLAGIICACAIAQQAPANPITSDIKMLYQSVKGNVIKSAEKMPEDQYGFQPTPEVRTFAAMLGHIADAQYLFCSAVKGEQRPDVKVEQTKKTKAELAAALNTAFAYCDPVYDSMTDAQGADIAKFFGRERSKLGLLALNNGHNFEHYGNLVTYLRMKGLVPPSSEGRR